MFREVNPILESSSRYGSHHLISVVTDTPALKANSDLDIAFIKSYIINIARPEGAQALRAIPPNPIARQSLCPYGASDDFIDRATRFKKTKPDL